MNANDKKLTELLGRWQTGDFTRADEQELQRLLAEGDEFSRAAVEGYLSTPLENHQQRLASIHKKLNPKHENKSFWSGRLLAVAAAVALLLVAVWWINQPQQTEEKIAQGTPPATAPREPAADLSDQTAAAPAATEPVSSSPPEVRRIAGLTPSASRRADTISPSPMVYKEMEALDEIAAEDDFVKATENAGEALEEVAITEAPNNPVVRSSPASSPNNAILQPPVAVESKKEAEKDQMVSAKAKKSSDRGGKVSAAKPTSTQPAPSAIAGPTPAGGWDKFRAEMRRQLVMPQDAKNKGVFTGTVTMILDINAADGKIRSVIFVNRLGFGCDERAEQFVQKYNWIVMPGGSNEVEIEVLFK